MMLTARSRVSTVSTNSFSLAAKSSASFVLTAVASSSEMSDHGGKSPETPDESVSKKNGDNEEEEP